MKLIGMLDSPFVRRAAITLKLKGLAFEHLSLSVFRDFDRFQSINPLVKAPTLVGDDGWQLVDSTLIIDWAETVGSGPSLMLADPNDRLRTLRLIGLGSAWRWSPPRKACRFSTKESAPKITATPNGSRESRDSCEPLMPNSSAKPPAVTAGSWGMRSPRPMSLSQSPGALPS